MKTVIISTAIAALTAGAALAEGHGTTVRLATEGAYAPYNYINDAGEIDGFEKELGDELCVRAGLTCEWLTNDWDSIIPNLVATNYDVIIAGMSITDERKQVIDFTENYTQPDPSAYVALSGNDVDLSSAVIAAQTATIQASYVAESGATLLEFSNLDETLAAVRNGEADAVLADRAVLEPVLGDDLAFFGENVMIGGGVGMGVRQSDTELRDKFTAAIQSMKADGSLNALIAKWEIGEQF